MNTREELGKAVAQAIEDFDGSIAETDGVRIAQQAYNEEIALHVIKYLAMNVSLEEALTSDSENVQALAKKWSR
jgi:hypothetical protein